MANKKINQLVTKLSIGTSDLFMIGDASTGQLYKKTIADLQATITGSISGSGSGGYITKFTGTTVIGNSLIYETPQLLQIFLMVQKLVFLMDQVKKFQFKIRAIY